MSRVSVVIPVYDDGALVREAIDSIDEREPVEIVVVDDGSTDEATLAVLDELRGRGVAVLRQDNAGPGAARTTGAASATTPYVFPLDADDLLVPGALGRLADLLDDAPQAGFAWGDYDVFGEYDGRYRAPSAFLPWTVTWVNTYPVSSLIRRTALERAGAWPDHGYEDWSLWLRFVELEIGGVALGDVVYRRRLHGAGRVLARDRREHRRIYDELKERHATLFANRAELRARERPSAIKRVGFPILFGARAIVPFRVEAWLQRTMMKRAFRLSR